ncbi:MAG: signal peptidase II [Clostridia bacterium]|nr:signal peptidase II [Clostridia bacterium]
MKRSAHAEWFGYLLIFTSIVGLDQLVKILAFQYLQPISTYELLPGVFRLQYCENTGAAFSILAGQTWFFILLTVLFCSVIIFLLLRGSIHSAAARIALVCVVSGGIGNLIDRVFRGFVVDMFDFYLINFAVFNVADIFVCCGSALFILLFLSSKGEILD